jgi:hypothetical protein
MPKIRLTVVKEYEVTPGDQSYPDCETAEQCAIVDRMEYESGKADIMLYLDEDFEATFEVIPD